MSSSKTALLKFPKSPESSDENERLRELSFVILQLEVTSGALHPKNFNFKADWMPRITASNKAPTAADLSSEAKAQDPVDVNVSRGQRGTSEISIETYKIDPAGSSGTAAAVVGQQNVPKPRPSKPQQSASASNVAGVVVAKGVSKGESSSHGSSREASLGPKKSDSASAIETIGFFSGNPFVEKTEGVLHFYKRNDRTKSQIAADGKPKETSQMLCMLAVPATLTSQDLLQFLTPVSQTIEQMRIIRTGSSNQYMVLIKFRNQSKANEFYNNYNGAQFNSLEPDICHLVYVAAVETTKESEGVSGLEGATELPTCPVCLERMDESVDGILTILCNHSFHGQCLSQWGDTSCPVCRYCQTPELQPESKCFVCGKQNDLWICIICGNIGCGRYEEAHAHSHFQQTSHTYSLQVGTQRVWDYAGDNYVHRLIQTKGDGKVVEFEPGQQSGNQVDGEEKIEGITLEYTYLLTSQLESQRNFFEQKVNRIESASKAKIESLDGKVTELMAKCDKLSSQLASRMSEKTSADKKLNQVTAKLTKVSNELKEEQTMNNLLRKDTTKWNKEVADYKEKLDRVKTEKEREIQDLQEQLRDMMFHFEAKEKLEKETPAEVKDEVRGFMKEGHVGVTANTASNTPGRRKKKK